MIARFLSFLLLLYALGFILFGVTLGRPAKAGVETDAVVVVTGGTGRIERAIEVLARRRAERVLIAGADPSVTKADLIERVGRARLVRCCVDLGSESVDTRSNAEEAQRWLARHKYKSLRLVTNDWHMRRAAYEFRRALGSEYEVVQDAVPTEPGFATLFAEYNKFVLRRLAVWIDV
ncbi:MAG TPA: YdcF family protein [Sphingomicrobium sp.]|nr:YdcF family protein [Sphingomicrobium sp.]